MEAEASKLPKLFPNLQASGVDTHVKRGSALERGIKGPYGTIFY